MARVLRDIVVKRIDLVDAGANQHATVELWKRAGGPGRKEEGTMSAYERASAAARELMGSSPGLAFHKALGRVWAANEELYLQHVQERRSPRAAPEPVRKTAPPTRTDAFSEAIRRAADAIRKSAKPVKFHEALAAVWAADEALYRRHVAERGPRLAAG